MLNYNRICDDTLELHYNIDFWSEISPRHHYVAENREIFANNIVFVLHQIEEELKCYVWQKAFINAFLEIYETLSDSFECLDCQKGERELIRADVKIEQTPDEIVVKVPIADMLQMFTAFGNRDGYAVTIKNPNELVEEILSELDNPSFDYEYATCSEVMIVAALQYLKPPLEDLYDQ